MKKVTIAFILLVQTFTEFSQEANAQKTLTRQEYLAKSKKQKTTGLILLSGGVAFGTISVIVALSKSDISPLYLGGLAGGGMIIASVPFLNVSVRNKTKGISLSFKNETAPQIQKNSFVYRPVPSLTLRFSL
jgi:hypothetical protein